MAWCTCLNSNNESVTIWSAKTNYEIEGVPGENKKNK